MSKTPTHRRHAPNAGGAVMRSRRAILIALLALFSSLPMPARSAEVTLGQTGGIYTVPVQINRSVTAQFLVDPGSAVVVIPRSILKALVLNGTLTQNDVVGSGIAELADSSLYEAVHIRLREMRLGDIVLRDVVAAVSPGLSQPLLGQTFLGRFASVTFDNQRHRLILNGSDAGPNSEYSASVQTAPTYRPALPGASNAYGQPNYGWPNYGWPNYGRPGQ